jgi:mannose-6-phosphate isomerase-like protein (cupin superfamily)
MIKRFLFLYFAFSLLAFGLAGDLSTGLVVSSLSVPVFQNEAGNAEVQLLLEKEKTGNPNFYLGRASFLPGSGVAEHTHENSIEMVYLISGSGEFTMAGKTYSIQAGDAMYIPMKTVHSFHNTGKETVEVIQMYSPAGPEERFKNWKRK